MTLDKFIEAFDKFDGEYLESDRIPQERRLSNRPDLNAFLLMDKLVPETGDLICGAEHDEIRLEVSTKDLAKAASVEQVVDLIRCGVRYDKRDDCLYMFA